MKSPELTEFFSLLGKAKKEKEEEFDNLLKEADINLDVLVKTVSSGMKEAEVQIKEQKEKEEKLIEQLDSIIDVIGSPKEVKDITEPAITVGVPEDFDMSKLEEEDSLIVQDWNNGDDIKFTEVDAVDIIKPEPIKTPEISDTVAKAIKFIEETNIKEEIENSDETSIDNLKGEIKQVRDILYKVLAHGPGSGEVNLLKLDDVDEDTAKVDGKFLKYDSSSGKFIGADSSSSGITTANVRTGILDVAGIATFRNDTLIGSGVTISPDGNLFATGVTTSSNFVGDLTGDVTGTASNATLSVNAQGLTGTPNITVGSVNASSGTFSGNVTVDGVLTYEDVTNVDSIGIITARSGLVVGSGVTLSKDGDGFFTGITTSTKAHVGVDTGAYGEDLVVTGDARVTGILTVGTGSIVLDPTDDTITANSFSGNLTGDVYLNQCFVHSSSTTTTSTSQTAVHSFSVSTYRSAKFQIQITRGSEFHITEIYLVHDGTSSYGTEYATIKTGSTLATFDSDINSGSVRLLATSTSSTSTTFKLMATLTKV